MPAVASAIAFTALVVMVNVGRPELDLDIARWVAARRTEAGIDTAEAISIVGSVVGIVPLALVFAYFLRRRDGWAPVRSLVLGCAGATTLYLIVNVIIRSARPPMPLRVMDEVGWSFPSGHSTQAIVFWPLAVILYAQTRRGRALLLVPAFAIVLAIGASRIYLDVHWTTDVASGFLLGLTWLCTVLALRERPR